MCLVAPEGFTSKRSHPKNWKLNSISDVPKQNTRSVSITRYLHDNLHDILTGNHDDSDWIIFITKQPPTDAAQNEDLPSKIKNASEYNVAVRMVESDRIGLEIIAKQRNGYVIHKIFDFALEIRKNDAALIAARA